MRNKEFSKRQLNKISNFATGYGAVVLETIDGDILVKKPINFKIAIPLKTRHNQYPIAFIEYDLQNFMEYQKRAYKLWNHWLVRFGRWFYLIEK